MDERQILKIIAWNRFMAWLIVIVGLWVGITQLAASIKEQQEALHVSWLPSDEIRLSSMSDGPFVATHLVAYGQSEGDKRVALLPEPVAIVDSAGATVKKEVVDRLDWRDIYGEPSKPDMPIERLVVLYYRPLNGSFR